MTYSSNKHQLLKQARRLYITGKGPSCSSVRVGLDYSEEAHWSENSRECSNVIGYKLGCHWPGFTLQPMLLQWRTSSMDENMVHMPTRGTFLLGEFSGGQVSWATSNPWTRNLTSKKFQHESFFFHLVRRITITSNPWTRNLTSKKFQHESIFSILFTVSPLPQITLSWVKF